MHSADEAVPHVDVRQKIIKVNTFPPFLLLIKFSLTAEDYLNFTECVLF